jgi:hypothetical protein
MTRAPHVPLSLPGLTGRSGTPPLFDLVTGFPAYWIPAFAGMTSGGRDDELWEGQNNELEPGPDTIRTGSAPK